jgi:hypothetical protein
MLIRNFDGYLAEVADGRVRRAGSGSRGRRLVEANVVWYRIFCHKCVSEKLIS